MPETSRPARVKTWVRALSTRHWIGEAGQRFRTTLSVIARFGRDNLHLDEKLRSLYEASWARAEGQIAGKEQSEALAKWQEAEDRRIDNKLKEATLTERIAQEQQQTKKLKSETARTDAETLKTQAEAEKLRAEAARLRAEATKIRLDAAINLADQLSKNKVWFLRDKTGAYHLVPLPDDTDMGNLYRELIPAEQLETLLPDDDPPSTAEEPNE